MAAFNLEALEPWSRWMTLNNMIALLQQHPSVCLLKHVVHRYLRLSDNVRARVALKQCLSMTLHHDTFGTSLNNDITVKKWLSQLHQTNI